MNGQRPSLFRVLASAARVMHRERPERLRAFGIMAFVVSLFVVLLLSSISRAPEAWQPVVEVVQGLLAILALLIGGVWAFYVFILGRAHSASVQIQLRFKQVMSRSDSGEAVDNRAVISVKLKNTGRTRVDKRRCKIGIEPIRENQMREQPALQPITNTMGARGSRWYPVFGTLIGLEPGEEYESDILFPMGRTLVFKIAFQFVGVVGPTILPSGWRGLGDRDWRTSLVKLVDERRREKTWGSRQIMDVREMPQATDVRMVQ